MRGVTLALAAIAGVLATSGLAQGETKTLGVSQVGTMVSPAGETRFLFKVSGLERLGPVVIGRATLTLPYALTAAEDRRVNLRAMPLTRDWTGSVVSWTGSWTRAGGDYDEELYSRARADLRRASGAMTFDLTIAVKEMVEQGADDYGFLITVEEAEGGGLRSADIALLGGLPTSTVEVAYRTTPVGPMGAAR